MLQLKDIVSSHCGATEINMISIHEDVGLIPGIAQWVGDLALAWCRWQTCIDPALLWLYCSPAAAAPIQPLAWGLPLEPSLGLCICHGCDPKNEKKKKKKKKNKKKKKKENQQKKKKKKKNGDHRITWKTRFKKAINTYLSIITLNVNGLNAPIKRHRVAG